ncbi:MOSC domain-containing protein [Gluconacetobacter azotocaptans]|uniref:MOSC domain-containing protein n=1 Tax=Gluconacetobacter azotocaptans TaxID=142834 RepID=UPI00195A3FD0|nr:MOSC N-terminal beta barrel domain-containing protein [Gluconacetobacter azotocaptans]MBM9401987.1 MOSC domain-containing protein [Gluconacetobacter azotocaptans]
MTDQGFRIAALHVYPVKSLGMIPVTQGWLGPCGLDDDRRWLVVDPDGRFLTQRQIARMALVAVGRQPAGLTLALAGQGTLAVDVPPAESARRPVRVWGDTVPAVDAGAAAADWLSAALGRPCRLVYLHDTGARPADPAYAPPGSTVGFADGFAALLATTESLAALNDALPTPVPMDRFRPNIVISGAPAWAEDEWRLLAIGSAVLRIVKPCSRCVMTTIDQQTAHIPDPREPLQTLSRTRRAKGGVMFGQNAAILHPGRIAVGDPVTVLERGPSNLLPA